MAGEQETATVEQRNYFRVRCRLAIRLREVRDEERDGLEREILQHEENAGLGDLDPQIAGWMDRIESKLDRILLHLGVVDEPLRPSDVADLVISGSGLRLVWDESHEPGTLLLVELELPGTPAYPVRCLASVVAREEDERGRHDMALSFSAIHARDREAIVRFTLDVERGSLRSRADDREIS
jgi:hypothetical protein